MISFDNIISSDTIPFEIIPQLSDQQIEIGQVELIIGDNYQIIQNKNIVDIRLKNEAQKYTYYTLPDWWNEYLSSPTSNTSFSSSSSV